MRLRFLVRGSAPLPVSGLRLLAQNETFIHVVGSPDVVPSGFDQNRSQASLQWRPVKWLTLELGYMLQVSSSLVLSHNSIVSVAFRLPKWDPFPERAEDAEIGRAHV